MMTSAVGMMRVCSVLEVHLLSGFVGTFETNYQVNAPRTQLLRLYGFT